MAGTAGFEPANVGVKGRCLTAWRRPCIRSIPAARLFGGLRQNALRFAARLSK